MSSPSGLLEWLDIALLFLIGAFLVVLSVVVIVRIFRGQATEYDQLTALPESWRRCFSKRDPNKNRHLLSQSN
jgi:hypothetical protein